MISTLNFDKANGDIMGCENQLLCHAVNKSEQTPKKRLLKTRFSYGTIQAT